MRVVDTRDGTLTIAKRFLLSDVVDLDLTDETEMSYEL